MTFYGKYFRGPLDALRKKFAAYSTSREKFSMPTLIGKSNKHNRNNVHIVHVFSSCERVIIEVVKRCRAA